MAYGDPTRSQHRSAWSLRLRRSTHLAPLCRFLRLQAKAAAYLLIPAIYSGNAAEPPFDLHILKHQLVVRDAVDVGPNDIEAMALSDRIETDAGGKTAR